MRESVDFCEERTDKNVHFVTLAGDAIKVEIWSDQRSDGTAVFKPAITFAFDILNTPVIDRVAERLRNTA